MTTAIERVGRFARWLHSYGTPRYGVLAVNDSPELSAADLRELLALAKSRTITEDDVERAKWAFRAFFHERGENIEWDGWGEGHVLVDAVFPIDELMARIIEALTTPKGEEG